TTVTGETDGFKKFDIGGAFGAEYQISENLGATIRYYTGLSNIAQPVDGETGTMKNKAFGISFAYRF
ncbi:MAG: outer membrane beta-barrel protein, partial [Chitinophagaceae bacterium]